MAFIITLLAGLSTLLGSIFVFFKFKNKYRVINMALSFAAAIMITVSIFDLIPEGYNLLSGSNISLLWLLISINIGIIISMFIDKNIHGNDLNRVGIISMIAIIIHNIPEGIATFIACNHDLRLGIPLAIAITLHNIPEGLAVGVAFGSIALGLEGASLMGAFMLVGIGQSAGKILAWLGVAVLAAHTVIGVMLTFRTLKSSKANGKLYFRQNSLFWARRASGLAILILIFFHIGAFGKMNDGKYRLLPFTNSKLITQLLLVFSLFTHIFVNIRPLLISLGVIKYKEHKADIFLILSILLLFISGCIVSYYIGWNYR